MHSFLMHMLTHRGGTPSARSGQHEAGARLSDSCSEHFAITRTPDTCARTRAASRPSERAQPQLCADHPPRPARHRAQGHVVDVLAHSGVDLNDAALEFDLMKDRVHGVVADSDDGRSTGPPVDAPLVPAASRHTHMLFVPRSTGMSVSSVLHLAACHSNGSAAAADAEALGRERARTASVHSLRCLWLGSALLATHVAKPLRSCDEPKHTLGLPFGK